MIRKLLRKLGAAQTTLALTVTAILFSLFLYLLSSIVLGEIDIRGVTTSIIIPAIIAPILSYFFLRVTIRLDLSEKALRENEEKYRTILDRIEDGYFEVDNKGNFTYFNNSLCIILGYTALEMMGMNYKQYMDKKNAKKALQAFNRVYTTEYPTRGFDWEIIKKDGTKRHVDASVSLIKDAEGNRIGFRGMVGDVTDRRRAEEDKLRLENKLRQAQKMEAVGTLAGGIAHDFNNILSVILGYTELSLMSDPDSSEIMNNLTEIHKAGKRAKDMVKQILAFSRQSEQERKPIQVSHIVKEALRMLRASLPTTIEIRQHIDGNAGITEADPTQIHQVLMNLCTNAAHAMNAKGGILEVSLADVDMDKKDAANHPDIQAGPFLKLSVKDTGHGISHEVLERIFDPYYTTKEKGQGTGLGLAVVQGIIKAHDGAVSVESVLGKGSAFHVYLPRIEREVASEDATAKPLSTGHESILLVDDELALVEIGKQILQRLGYKVETRTSSVEALELFRADPARFDLVITDMTMPNITGEKLAEKLMEIRSDIPIVLCTGYSEHITGKRAKEMGIRSFLMKPLVIQDLAITLRQVLESN